MKKRRTDVRYPIGGKAISKVATWRFILGTALIDLSGLNTLKVLSDFRFGTLGISEMSPMMTTKKSRTFQGSLR
jgi:hypothetical protein